MPKLLSLLLGILPRAGIEALSIPGQPPHPAGHPAQPGHRSEFTKCDFVKASNRDGPSQRCHRGAAGASAPRRGHRQPSHCWKSRLREGKKRGQRVHVQHSEHTREEISTTAVSRESWTLQLGHI